VLDQAITRRVPCRVAHALSYAACSQPAGAHLFEHLAETGGLFGRHEQVPHLPAGHLARGVSGGSFTSAIEADDSPVGVEDKH